MRIVRVRYMVTVEIAYPPKKEQIQQTSIKKKHNKYDLLEKLFFGNYARE